VAKDKVSIDTPTQNLERYFLDVVQKARTAAAETSGAVSGARVAAYLREGADAKPSADKLLERLVSPQTPAPQPDPTPQPVEAVDEKKLTALTKKQLEEAPAPPTPPEADRKAELEQANEKLASLLGKKEP
jgi:hypothetical protein